MTANSIQFYSGSAGVEVLRLSKDGIWANPEIPVDETAKLVLEAINYNIKVLIQKAVEEEREACAKIAHGWSKREDDVGGYIAEAIRARENI